MEKVSWRHIINNASYFISYATVCSKSVFRPTTKLSKLCIYCLSIKNAWIHWSLLEIHRLSVDSQQKCQSLHWRHNGHDWVSNHQPYDCSLNRLFRRRSKKTSKLRATGLSVGNSTGTGEFPAQMASNAENISIWWRHHEFRKCAHVKVS